jgi:orotidine-5'-phosphate decarboxylase
VSRVHQVPLPRKTGLVVAIDLPDLARAAAVAREVAPFADSIKVGYPTVLAAGLSAVRVLAQNSGLPVICDFKVADIPPVSGAIARLALQAGARGVICQAFAGRDSVAAVAEACREQGALPIAVVEMSHDGGREFTSPHAEQLLNAALAGGAGGIVAPATRPERIAALRARAGAALIFSPGAGAQGGSPKEAARAGADFVIVGRSVVEARDPARAAAEAAAAIAEGARLRLASPP